MAEVIRHADHDPTVICRPAGWGLCVPLLVAAGPAPGSDEALSMGCRCPVIDNGHGRVPPEGRVIVEGCPVHWPVTS